MFKKIKNFTKSLTKHIANGMPKSSQELIDKRYSICLGCSSFDEKNQECTVCGCNVNKERKTMNKLAWEDSKCPLNKW
jgi:rRNA maturation endonuclease Nob1